MTAQITTLTIKDGAGNDRAIQAVDLSGTGAGPWSFLHGLVDAGGAPIATASPLAVNDAAVVTLVGSAGTTPPALATGASGLLGRLRQIVDGLGAVVLAAGSAVIGRVGLQIGGSDVTTSNPVPVAPQSVNYAHIDRSGTVTAGGTAQVLMAANASRKGGWIQNLSAGDLWISSVGTAAAAQPSMKIGAGVYYEFPANGVPNTAISIFGATTGQAFAAREW